MTDTISIDGDTIAAVAIISGVCAVVANLHPVGGIEAYADQAL